MIHLPRGYQQCVIIAAISRAGGRMSDAEIRRFAGPYATNILIGLVDHGYIESVLVEDGLWMLTVAGTDVARCLLGDVTSPATASADR